MLLGRIAIKAATVNPPLPSPLQKKGRFLTIKYKGINNECTRCLCGHFLSGRIDFKDKIAFLQTINTKIRIIQNATSSKHSIKRLCGFFQQINLIKSLNIFDCCFLNYFSSLPFLQLYHPSLSLSYTPPLSLSPLLSLALTQNLKLQF